MRAKNLFMDALADGRIEAKYLYELAAEDGISESTLDNAKEELGIVSIHSGGTHGLWFWEIPSRDNKIDSATIEEEIINC